MKRNRWEKEKLLKALGEAARAWTDENYLHLSTVEHIHRWLRRMRDAGNKRLRTLHRNLPS